MREGQQWKNLVRKAGAEAGREDRGTTVGHRVMLRGGRAGMRQGAKEGIGA